MEPNSGAVELAQKLRELEINIIPLSYHAKVPIEAWKIYQESICDKNVVYNYACICGKVSKNLVVVDIDKPDKDFDLNAILPKLKERTLVVKTGSGGYHIYLRSPDRLPKSAKADKGETHIDIQSEGRYVVGAGSIHPNGKKYEVISDTLIPEPVDFERVLKNIKKIGFTLKVNTSINDIAKAHITQGNRHDAAIKYANHLLFTKQFQYNDYIYELRLWNKENDPPIPEKELDKIIEDCWNYYQKSPTPKIVLKDNELDLDNIVDKLLEEKSFITMFDNDDVYFYENGFYQLNVTHSEIKKYCYETIPKCRKSIVSEVIEMVKVRTRIRRELLDPNPDIINLENGLYDLKKNKLKTHTPTYKSLYQIPVSYNPNAIPFTFLKFIKEILEDPFHIYLVLEGFANCLLKNSNYEKAFMLIGEGRNGKSTFLGIMKNFLGIENVAGVSIHDLAADRFAIAGLHGKLANIHPDIESGELKGTGIIKGLISGDLVSAQRKFGHAFNFENKAKLFFSANRFPEVDDQTTAFFRRFFIIPFENEFTPDIAQPDLKERISNDPDEMSGILNILLRLIPILVKRRSFRVNNSIKELQTTWNKKSNPIKQYLEENLHMGADYYQSKPELYQDYRIYCDNQKVPKESAIKFYREIKLLFPSVNDTTSKIINGNSTQVYLGFCLKSKLHIYKQQNAEQTRIDNDEGN